MKKWVLVVALAWAFILGMTWQSIRDRKAEAQEPFEYFLKCVTVNKSDDPALYFHVVTHGSQLGSR